jgi:hypothetical protein
MRRAARTTARTVQPGSPARRAAAAAVVDAIADASGRRVTAVPSDERVVVTGWALDEGAAAFERIEIAVGEARATTAFTERRRDVAAAFGSPESVGYRAELALDRAAPGRYPVALTGVRANGERIAIPVAVALDVVAPLRAILPGVREGELQGALDEVRAEGHAVQANGEPVLVATDTALIVRGWAASTTNVPAAFAYAEIDGERIVRGMAGHERPDVATALGTEYADYGFRIRIPAGSLALGAHVLRAVAVADGVVSRIGEPVRLSVDGRPGSVVYPRGDRLGGRIDVIARLDGERQVCEERTHVQLAPGERAVVTGWSGDPVRGALPDRLVLAVDGVAHGTVQRGIEREDVVRGTDSPGLIRSGFSAMIRAERLGAGFHRAEVIAFFGEAPSVIDAFSFEITG